MIFNKDHALIAIKHDARNVSRVSIELRDTKEVMEFAILRNPFAIIHASDRLKRDRHFIHSMIHRLGWGSLWMLIMIQDIYKDDKETIEIAMKYNAEIIQIASDKISNLK